MPLSSENMRGLYVTVPIYFALLCAASYWAHRRMGRLVHGGVADTLSAHYLGGRTFGPFLTAGTTFASIFSGYTVIGIPNEAYNQGWTSLRWIPWLLVIIMGYFGTSLRLRKASNIRNHQTPVDFITDRFQSQILRYNIVLLQVLPAIIFLAAQVVSIKNTFNAMFGLDPDLAYPVIIIMALILVFEWVGGLSSVALTDSIQAVIMVFSFVAVPTVLATRYYSWADLSSATYPRPEYYDTPSKNAQLGMWQTSMILISYFTLPHYVQRIYATEGIHCLKLSFCLLNISTWFTMLPAVFIGTVGVQILGGEAVSSPFTSIIEALLDLGGFATGLGYVVLTASIAAIMSTTDSLVIAISQLITTEVFYPLAPNTTPGRIAWVGRISSLMSATFALLVGLYWKGGITALTSIQFPLTAQAMPAFLFGMYGTPKTEFHPWSIAFGTICSTIFCMSIIWAYIGKEDDPLPIDAGLTGLVVNLVLTLVAEGLWRLVQKRCSNKATKVDANDDEHGDSGVDLHFPRRPAWDVPKLRRFGETPLTSRLLWKAMEGINEPFANPWWIFLCLLSITICTPILPENVPPIEEESGIPWWAKKMIYTGLVPFAIIAASVQNMPSAFPVDKEKIEKEGIDPELVELTLREKGKRTSYDDTNLLIQSRRESISQIVQELGLSVTGAPDVSKSQRIIDAMMKAEEVEKTSLSDVDIVGHADDKGSARPDEEGGLERATSDII